MYTRKQTYKKSSHLSNAVPCSLFLGTEVNWPVFQTPLYTVHTKSCSLFTTFIILSAASTVLTTAATTDDTIKASLQEGWAGSGHVSSVFPSSSITSTKLGLGLPKLVSWSPVAGKDLATLINFMKVLGQSMWPCSSTHSQFCSSSQHWWNMPCKKFWITKGMTDFRAMGMPHVAFTTFHFMSSMRKSLSTSHNKVLHACSMLVSYGRWCFVTVVTCTGGVWQQVLEAYTHCRVMPTWLYAAHLSISRARFLLKETSNSKNNLLGPHTFLCDFEWHG